MRVLDADGHTLEPPDLLDRHLDPGFRHRVVSTPGGRLFDGQPVSRHPPHTLESLRFTPDLIRQRYGDLAEEGFSARAVIRALDVEGIEISVIYGPLYDCWIEGMDPELACRDRQGLQPVARRVHGRIRRTHKRGGAHPAPRREAGVARGRIRLRNARVAAFWTRPNPVGGRMLGHGDFEPFYEMLAALDAPLSLHEGSGSMMQNIGNDRFNETWLEQHACVHPMEQQMAMASLIVQGVLERHPGLRVAFMESGSAWAPAWLHRLDEHAELVGWRDAPYLTARPSEYFTRQCFISCDPEEALLHQVVDVFGDRNVIFATDFPHPDAKYPNALKSFLGLPGVTEDSKRRILWDNAVRFYGFDDC